METISANRVNMIRTTLNYCTNNPNPTSGILAFAGVKTTTENKLLLIDQLDQIVVRSVKDVTLDTILIRKAMSNIALKCGDAVSAYATGINNNVLRGKVTYTLPQLNRFKKDEVDDICQVIHDEANSNILLAGPFGYTATDVTDLLTAITLYRASMQDPRAFTVSKKQAVANIKLLIREIIDINLKGQLDKMVNTVKATAPDFVQGYYFSREIIDLGSTTAKVRGIIRNPEGTFLAGAKFYLTITGQTTKVGESLADSLGKYGIANLPANDYDLYWENLGYITQTETNVHISAGKEITRNITLQHIIYSGTINSGQLINILGPSNPEWRPGATIKIKNTTTTPMIGGINFFPALNPGDSFSGEGSTLLPGQEETHIITASEFKPYLNIQNQGPNSGTYEITFL
jgi:hypothetical protein